MFHQIAEKWGFEILALEIMPDHVHSFQHLQSMHYLDIQGSIFKLGKRYPESKINGSELWARSYFVAIAGNAQT